MQIIRLIVNSSAQFHFTHTSGFCGWTLTFIWMTQLGPDGKPTVYNTSINTTVHFTLFSRTHTHTRFGFFRNVWCKVVDTRVFYHVGHLSVCVRACFTVYTHNEQVCPWFLFVVVKSRDMRKRQNLICGVCGENLTIRAGYTLDFPYFYEISVEIKW